MNIAPPVAEHRERSAPAAEGVFRFVSLAYVLAWAWTLPLVVAGQTVEQGQGWPTHVPSLLAPLVAAVVAAGIVDGRGGIEDLVRRITRWRFSALGWLAVASPVLILGLTLSVMRVLGQELPAVADFARFTGLPDAGVAATFLLVLLANGLGEEVGWRGFLQDRLQRRFSPLSATLIVSLVWAIWHAPFFFVLSTYSGFDATTLVAFPLGLTAGAIVLTWLYNHTGRSILAVALWHTLYNMSVATAGATDVIQGVVTAAVMVAATVLIFLEVLAGRRGGRSVLGSPA